MLAGCSAVLLMAEANACVWVKAKRIGFVRGSVIVFVVFRKTGDGGREGKCDAMWWCGMEVEGWTLIVWREELVLRRLPIGSQS